MVRTVLTPSSAHLKTVQASDTGGEPAWVVLAWVVAESMIDTTINAITGRQTGVAKGPGVLPVRVPTLNPGLHLRHPHLPALSSAVFLAGTPHPRIRGLHHSSLTAYVILLRIRVVTALYPVQQLARWRATPKKQVPCIQPGQATIFFPKPESLTITVATADRTLPPTFIILDLLLGTHDVTALWSQTTYRRCLELRQVTAQKGMQAQTTKSAAVTAGAGLSMSLAAPIRRTTLSLQRPVFLPRTQRTKT